MQVARIALSGVLLLGGLSVLSPARAGGWIVEIQGKGLTLADNTSGGEWMITDQKYERWGTTVGGTFTQGTDGFAGFENNPPQSAGHSNIAAQGTVSAVLKWKPAPGRTLKEDPPSTVIQVWETSSANYWKFQTSGGFETSNRNVECAFDAEVQAPDGLTRWVSGTNHMTLKNPGRSPEVRLPTRHLKATSNQTFDQAHPAPSVYHHVDVNYSVSLDPLSGQAQFIVTNDGEIANQQLVQSLRQVKNLNQNDWKKLSSLSMNNAPTLTGDVWVGFETVAGPDAKLDPDIETVTGRMKLLPDAELGAAQYPGTQTHLDLTFPLRAGAAPAGMTVKWEKQSGPIGGTMGPWQETTEPFSTPAPEDTLVKYRVRVKVKAGKIQGLNGQQVRLRGGSYVLAVVKVDGMATQHVDYVPAKSDAETKNFSHTPQIIMTQFNVAAAPEVLKVTPSETTKVIISDVVKKSPYPDKDAQTRDAEIKITATVRGRRGDLVYFEVTDPDDRSPYPEGPSLTTTDTLPNDNRDPGISGSRGYQDFQQACLPVTTAQLGDTGSKQITADTWQVSVPLVITQRYSGDNYIVNATCDVPDTTKYFSQQPNVVKSFKPSGLLVAWKRIYLEIDEMHVKGTTMVFGHAADGDADDDVIYVDNAQNFKKDDQIVLFQRSGTPLTVQRTVKAVTGATITVADLNVNFPKWSGIKLLTENDSLAAKLNFLINAYGDNADGSDGGCFVEFIHKVKGSGSVPKYTLLTNDNDAFDFAYDWFNNKGNRRNVVLLLVAHEYIDTYTTGITERNLKRNLSIVNINNHRPESLTPGGTIDNSIAETVVHEIGHQFNVDTIEHHVDKKITVQNHEKNGFLYHVVQ